jgi:hypothetical protein
LRKSAHRVEEFADVEVCRTLLSETPDRTPSLAIKLAVPFPVALRLDRLLAVGLGLSRNCIAAMAEAGRLSTSGALNKRCRDGGKVRLDLTDKVDAETIWRAAISQAAASGHKDCPG